MWVDVSDVILRFEFHQDRSKNVGAVEGKNFPSPTEKAHRLYRVVQNKIPHQTICNIFATSGQILKILEAV